MKNYKLLNNYISFYNVYMKKLVTLFAVILTVLSCNSDENKEKINQLRKEIVKQRFLNDSILDKNYSWCMEKTERLESEVQYYSNQEKKMDFFLLKEDSWLTVDNKKLIELFFEDFNLEKFDADSAITFSWLFHPVHRRQPVDSETNFANYIISKIDRSSESLDTFFTPEIKEFIYAILKQHNIYEESGAYAMVKALLLAYEGFEYEQEPLSRIYNVAVNSSDTDAIKTIISSMASEEILEALSDENYSSYTSASDYSSEEFRLYTIYTFWARRYNEGNLEFTYYFLKDLHNNVANEAM